MFASQAGGQASKLTCHDPSAAYLNFINHEEIYSFAMSPTFVYGCHVPFNRPFEFSPLQWPPPLYLKSVAEEAVRGVLPYCQLAGISPSRRVWIKPWDDGDPSVIDLSAPHPIAMQGKPYADAVFEVAQVAHASLTETPQPPTVEILAVREHPEIASRPPSPT